MVGRPELERLIGFLDEAWQYNIDARKYQSMFERYGMEQLDVDPMLWSEFARLLESASQALRDARGELNLAIDVVERREKQRYDPLRILERLDEAVTGAVLAVGDAYVEAEALHTEAESDRDEELAEKLDAVAEKLWVAYNRYDDAREVLQEIIRDAGFGL